MRRTYLVTSLVGVFVAVMAVAVPRACGAAEEEAAPAKAKAKAADSAEKKSDAKKTVRRLPMYYAQVVDETQREKIYGIQAQFNAKIEPLRAQLEALEKDRDAQIVAVLTPDQKKQVDDLRTAAKAGRDAAKKATTKTKGSSKPKTEASAKKTDEAAK